MDNDEKVTVAKPKSKTPKDGSKKIKARSASSRRARLLYHVPITRDIFLSKTKTFLRKKGVNTAMTAFMQAIGSDVIAEAVKVANADAKPSAKRVVVTSADITKAISKIPAVRAALGGNVVFFGSAHRKNWHEVQIRSRAGKGVVASEEQLANRIE